MRVRTHALARSAVERLGVPAQGMALLAYAARIGNAGLLFVLHVLLARWLGEYEFGTYVLVWTWVTLLGLVSALGVGTGMLRFIPEYREAGALAKLRGLLFAGRWMVIVAATALALTGAGLAWLFGAHADSHYVLPFMIGLVCLPLLSLTAVQDGIARSYNWVNLALLPPFVLRPALILLLMLGAHAAGLSADATTALYCAVAATWLSAVAQGLLLNRRLGRVLPGGPRAYDVPLWFRVSFPLLLVDGFHIVMVNTDVMVLSLFVGPDRVGLYFAAAKLLALASMVHFAVSVASGHRYASYYASGDMDGLASFVRSSSRMTFWPSTAISALVIAFGYPLLLLFGGGFTSAYPVLFVLAIGILARASVGPADRLLSVIGEQDAVARIFLTSLVTNVALNLAFVPMFGIFGAAVATSIALMFESYLLDRRVRRRIGVGAFVFSGASS